MTSSNKSPEQELATKAEKRVFARPLSLMVAGRAENTVREIVARLSRDKQLAVSSRIISNGHADPLHGTDEHPDALVFVLSAAWQDELQSLADRPAASRPPSLIIGLEVHPQAMRLAMRAGAREFLKWPEQVTELRSALMLIAGERIEEQKIEHARITTVINAKGGSGGTFVASSLAHIYAAREHKKTALLDLEMQFASLGSYFDLHLRHGLAEVLEAIPDMDQVALGGYMTHHESGVDLLGSHGGTLGTSDELDGERFMILLQLLSLGYERLVIDVPRHLDHLTIGALENSDKIIVVLQQNLASLKDAIRLLAVMRNELSIAKSEIMIVVNRYDKNSEISLNDIRSALSIKDVHTVPNDFALVNESLNSGQPIFAAARKARITRTLVELAVILDGKTNATQPGLVKSALAGIKTFYDSHKSE